jgi:S1-C subfamily serine protease
MKSRQVLAGALLAVAALLSGTAARADGSFATVADEVNQKLVKLFGAGGIRGLPAYGTGVLVSPDGYVLTINSHILDTRDLRIYTYDGTRYHGRVVATEPELDVALVKIDTKDTFEHYFDVAEAAREPVAGAGTGVLAFSNQFEIATRDEPVSVQRGVVAAYARLYGRIGIFEATYRGDVYVLDAITNNPGAGGGVVTTRKGRLLGLIGRELRNEQTNTWINYAVPIGARIEVPQPDGKTITTSILDLVEKKENYKPVPKRPAEGGGGYHGIILVANAVERTPPYVEEVLPGSPADRAKLRPDDLIVYVDGLPVVDINSFQEVLAKYRPGSEIKLEVQRGNKLFTVSLTLEKPKTRARPKKK